MSEVYHLTLGTAEVIKNNTLMNGITSTRGEMMGFIQENRLELSIDGAFVLMKTLKSTKTNPMITQPVSVEYRFRGTYTRDGQRAKLSKALSGWGHVDWGTFSQFLDTGNGDYDSVTSPGILSLYPTTFFIENCKNVPMTVLLDEAAHTFSIEPFEPVILSADEAGKVERQEQPLDPEAGLMKQRLVEGPNPFSLKETFERYGMKVGTCINPLMIESPYEEILLSQFSSVTLENHLKPSFTLNREKTITTGKVSVAFPAETVRLLDWCKAHDMPLRGHTLVWYLGTPEWVFHEGFAEDASNVDRDTLIPRMEEYIADFFAELARGGWADLMYCIDVVNEAVIAPDQMRKCPWQEIIGDDYLQYAYTFARRYAPSHVRLCYNDFDLETKTDKVIRLVNSLVDENGAKLVDIVGQQGHYGAYSSIATLGEALTKISRETGCELQITELDVSVSRQGTEAELKTQGRFYYDFVQQIRRLREEGVNVTGITLWGFADALSWMPSGFLHLYDRNLTPKYAYYGMLGRKDLAGFDGASEQPSEEGRISAVYTVSGQTDRCVTLHENGTFTDTTQGAELSGIYRYDGTSGYMLIPDVGSYCSLVIHPDGTAERIEGAGGKLTLIAR